MGKPLVVVVGAGVSGLTSALQLARTNKYNVTVVAKHVPGDYDIEYASPWAGADYLPVSKAGTAAAQHDRETWPELERLARDVPGAGIHFQNSSVYRREKEVEDPWFKDILPNFRHLSPDSLHGYGSGIAFTSVCINPSLYLPYLTSLLLADGIPLRRGVFSHIGQAARAHASGPTADVVVNCTGLSSLTLGGVADGRLYPARGQIVIVRNEANLLASTSGIDDGPEERCYIMQRSAGGGTVLGGCYQERKWNAEADKALSQRIMRRAVELCPALTAKESLPDGSGLPVDRGVESLSVVRESVGLRPVREGGVRLELEVIDGVKVVHNYGHGGAGYQSSYGCANVVVGLVERALQEADRVAHPPVRPFRIVGGPAKILGQMQSAREAEEERRAYREAKANGDKAAEDGDEGEGEGREKDG